MSRCPTPNWLLQHILPHPYTPSTYCLHTAQKVPPSGSQNRTFLTDSLTGSWLIQGPIKHYEIKHCDIVIEEPPYFRARPSRTGIISEVMNVYHAHFSSIPLTLFALSILRPSFSWISDTLIALGKSCLLAKTSKTESFSSSSLSYSSQNSNLKIHTDTGRLNNIPSLRALLLLRWFSPCRCCPPQI